MGERKNREGVVVSDAMQKTRVVKIERVFRHPHRGDAADVEGEALADPQGSDPRVLA